ncbi:RNA polymerase sigma factor [Sphingobium sp. EM0848]|uniref:RNA polymerase sigma factor n=1 Tax=Sphingobium sp. EM0848 TaxID=2743473 RepID=UPI0021015271|nr:sigma-70 family RNA polymerase sigma factor [Sphingobium sp. EM0848]
MLPHEPALRTWLNRRSPDGLDPDDIIQEAYAVIADLDTVESIRSPRAYLFQVARSVIVRHVRRSRVVSLHAVDDLAQLNHADDAPTPEQVAFDRDELRRLAHAIAAMPIRTREAFILRRVHSLSQREIAEKMALSESTVEKHISRGIRFLIERFDYGGKPSAKLSSEMDLVSIALDDRTGNQSGH